ncbi:MAG: tRNA lysidine(34) synthetase TilS, partial [Bacteroidota bacterium]|nr:tRNA lysidine(34) synthetase TilS [Bacteroidota bacterium]
LIIAPLQTEEAQHILIEEVDKKVAFPNGMLFFKSMSVVNHQPSTESNIATLDTTEIRYPLLLRKWKAGDYFYPLGMNKKKKLSKFFIDNKLSKTEKENVWILETNKKIIWVIGYRIDDRFKWKSNTKYVLLVEKK